MKMLVDAIEQLPSLDWDLLDDDYDGYDGEPREGVVSEDMADVGIGLLGAMTCFWRSGTTVSPRR